MRKLLQILDVNEQNIFTICKSKDKLQMYDNRWKIICEESDWEFIPSFTS